MIFWMSKKEQKNEWNSTDDWSEIKFIEITMNECYYNPMVPTLYLVPSCIRWHC